MAKMRELCEAGYSFCRVIRSDPRSENIGQKMIQFRSAIWQVCKNWCVQNSPRRVAMTTCLRWLVPPQTHAVTVAG